MDTLAAKFASRKRVFTLVEYGCLSGVPPGMNLIQKEADKDAWYKVSAATTQAGSNSPQSRSTSLYPKVKWTVAYLLRPFFQPPDSEREDIVDASKWIFNDESPWFLDTFRDDSQLPSPLSHLHLRLRECITMEPEDTVWSHARYVARGRD
ncbi:hypothetical protein AYL99_11784 [Fonsecaea erecta]|uniref:Uncharacterized protein n=1 Tax=Fonsecaea erecta TaxID=1367422 RepID=A0A178Z2U6_9EURO|nr:hypothetical protein AYL99_11784 [Fonsecaea erecta]OAP54024.1 hypothetical protein AYL99_11784 [Fonsecaea erecta]